jgi:hypothetical protein
MAHGLHPLRDTGGKPAMKIDEVQVMYVSVVRPTTAGTNIAGEARDDGIAVPQPPHAA